MSDDDWAPAAPRPLAEAVGTAPPVATPDGAPRLEGYSHLVEVARGGDSVVYRARQDSLDRDVAIKVIGITDPTAVARFERELAITVALGRQHPHIVTVLDTTTTERGEPCLVMEFHDLGSLHDRLRAHGPLPASEVVAAGTAVADALAFAHANGVLHRDVKPQNVLLLPTSYVLSDFGIARMADAGHTATVERFSYRHASPQVLDGLEPDESDDVWSLGSTLFTLLDGRAPFASDDPHEDTALSYLRRVRTGARRTLRRDDLPAGLVDLIEACLRPAREDRLASAAQALAALRAVRTEDRSWEPGGATASGAGAAAPRPPTAPSDAAPVRTAPVHQPPVVDAEPADPAPADPAPADPAPVDAAPAAPMAAPPPAPSPVAPSALAHVGAHPAPPPADTDAEATGLAPADAETAEAHPPARPAASSGWRRAVAFVGGALLVGGALGIGSALLRDDPGTGPTAPPTDVTVPTATDVPTTTDGPIQADTSNPDLAPVNLVLTDRGTSALLTWAPPADDVDYLIVLDVTDPEAPQALRQLGADAEEFVVEGLDPDDGAECYAVVGYAVVEGSLDAGSSATRCRG